MPVRTDSSVNVSALPELASEVAITSARSTAATPSFFSEESLERTLDMGKQKFGE